MRFQATGSRTVWRLAVTVAGLLAIGMTFGSLARDRIGSEPTDAAGGASGRSYNPSRQATRGIYKSSVSGPYAKRDAEQRGLEAALKDEAKPPFIGWVNGIYIFPESNKVPGFDPDPAANAEAACPGAARLVSEDELKASPYDIEIPSGLPSGAVESEGIYAEACGEQITLVSRQFDLQPYGGMIGIILRPQAKGAPFPATADRISAGKINGMSAVMVTPLTEEGFGNSAIFIVTPVGLAQVGGYDVRFDDLLAVAESIKWQ